MNPPGEGVIKENWKDITESPLQILFTSVGSSSSKFAVKTVHRQDKTPHFTGKTVMVWTVTVSQRSLTRSTTVNRIYFWIHRVSWFLYELTTRIPFMQNHSSLNYFEECVDLFPRDSFTCPNKQVKVTPAFCMCISSCVWCQINQKSSCCSIISMYVYLQLRYS